MCVQGSVILTPEALTLHPSVRCMHNCTLLHMSVNVSEICLKKRHNSFVRFHVSISINICFFQFSFWTMLKLFLYYRGIVDLCFNILRHVSPIILWQTATLSVGQLAESKGKSESGIPNRLNYCINLCYIHNLPL